MCAFSLHRMIGRFAGKYSIRCKKRTPFVLNIVNRRHTAHSSMNRSRPELVHKSIGTKFSFQMHSKISWNSNRNGGILTLTKQLHRLNDGQMHAIGIFSPSNRSSPVWNAVRYLQQIARSMIIMLLAIHCNWFRKKMQTKSPNDLQRSSSDEIATMMMCEY